MDKLTLTREQVPLARETVAWLRPTREATPVPDGWPTLPGYEEWRSGELGDDARWADALEAAITEAEGKDAEGPQPGPVSDADERAFWREAYALERSHDKTASASAEYLAHSASDAADAALARYRKAFCTGMPSDQKGAK